jgi:thiol:disulfide interchange protein DsbA
MKKLLGVLLFSFSMMMAFAQAAHAAPNPGYTVLAAPQPVNVPRGKVEVIEFFWYGCPHCNALDPYLEAWIKRQGKEVVFRRVPVAFNERLVPHSKLYHALQALGVEQRLTPIVFSEIHQRELQANREDVMVDPAEQAAFLARYGVDRKKFLAAYSSPATQNAVQRDNQLIGNYRIDGVPTLIVQGKYETGAGIASSLPGVTQALDFLVSQVRAGRM